MTWEVFAVASATLFGFAAGATWRVSRRFSQPPPTAAELAVGLTDPDESGRLAAVAALERHGVENPVERQLVIDLICRYLSDGPEPPRLPDASYRAAMRTLRQRLNTAYDSECWSPMHLDFTGGHVHDLDLSGCMLGELIGRRTHFHGTTRLSEAILNDTGCFEDAVFGGDAVFAHTYFGGDLRLRGAQWLGHVTFSGAGAEGGEVGTAELLKRAGYQADSEPRAEALTGPVRARAHHAGRS